MILLSENLCLRNSTILSLSSTHINNSASLANDGVISTKEMYCAITDRGLNRAWLQVDLGKQFNIKSIRYITEEKVSIHLIRISQNIDFQ